MLPGSSHSISHSTSASRDTGLLAYQVLPRVVLTTGGDFAWLGLNIAGMEWRAGLFGMFEVQTVDGQPGNFLSVPRGPYLWRGLLGYSLAVSFERLAERWFGDQAKLEAAIAFRHESEHYTGSEPMFVEVPNIGDFFMPEVAIQRAFGPLELTGRLQAKLFLPDRAYRIGPGADLILRWRALDWLHPLLAIFGEYLWARTGAEFDPPVRLADNYLLRGLAGVVFPGVTADLQLVLALSKGHDKGLLAHHDEFRIGWAIRIAMFKPSAR